MLLKERRLHDAKYAVIDFETTGLSPANERVVELSVVHFTVDAGPTVVLDTLINPNQPVSATWVHGITDDDVQGAPTFAQVLPALEAALSGAVLVSHNVYFDFGFLQAEARRLQRPLEIPHLCTMYLRPLLGLGERKSLLETCQSFGISAGVGHHAGTDALATASLLGAYLAECQRLSKDTFSDLARGKNYKFLKSFSFPLLERDDGEALGRVGSLQKPRVTPSEPALAVAPSVIDVSPARVPRPGPRTEVSPAELAITAPPAVERSPVARYLDAVSVMIEDLDVTDDELLALRALRRATGITDGQVRAVHAQLYALVLSEFSGDLDLDWAEQARLRFLHRCLQALGWAPGD